MLRRLRILVTVLCVMACVALVAMWIRSRWHADQWHGRLPAGRAFLLAAKQGRVAAVVFDRHPVMDQFTWTRRSHPVDSQYAFPTGPVTQNEAVGFGWLTDPQYSFELFIPTTPGGATVISSTTSAAQPTVSTWSTNSTTIDIPVVGSTITSGSSGIVDPLGLATPNSGSPSSSLSFDNPPASPSFGPTTGVQLSPPASAGSTAQLAATRSFSGSGTWTVSGNTSTGVLVLGAVGAPGMKLSGSGLIVPYWSLVLICGAVFVFTLGQRPWRFSLRGMLAAVTFVAVVLALSALIDS